MDAVSLSAAVIAVTEIAKRLVPSQVTGVVTIVVAAVLGGLAGLAGINGLNIIEGIVVGLAASGAVRVATAIGEK